MTKYVFLVVFIISWCCSEQSILEKYTANVSINYSTKYLRYEIFNNSHDKIYIPSSYSVNDITDSIIFEAYNKSSLIHYNQFMIPPLKMMPSNSSIEGGISIEYIDISTIKRSNYYFRIFSEDFKVYLHDKNIATYSEKTFLDFEKEHSLIVAASTN